MQRAIRQLSVPAYKTDLCIEKESLGSSSTAAVVLSWVHALKAVAANVHPYSVDGIDRIGEVESWVNEASSKLAEVRAAQ